MSVSRRSAAMLVALCLSVGVLSCSMQPVDEDALVAELRPGASTVERATPRVPRRGPFRHTGRAEYCWRVLPVTAERLGSSHRAGCPVPVADLRLLQLTHLGFDGRPRTGELVVHAGQADAVVEVFRRLYDGRFPVERMMTVEQYGSDDDRSMAANNTSSYNCRTTTGGSGFSEHAYGTALDINPVQNPYVRGTTVAPDAGRAYLDRSDARPGMVGSGDVVVRSFAAGGWEWAAPSPRSRTTSTSRCPAADRGSYGDVRTDGVGVGSPSASGRRAGAGTGTISHGVNSRAIRQDEEVPGSSRRARRACLSARR